MRRYSRRWQRLRCRECGSPDPRSVNAVCVIGLGLIGLIAVQLLRANGCRVLGVDPDPAKSALARRFGADVVDLGAGEDVLRGRGAAFPADRESMPF